MEINKLSPAINHIAKLKLDFSLIPKHYNHIFINYHDNRNTFLVISQKDIYISIDITLINNIYCNDVTCKITLDNNIVYLLWIDVINIHICNFDYKTF